MHSQAVGDHGRLGLFCASGSRAMDGCSRASGSRAMDGCGLHVAYGKSGSSQGRIIWQRVKQMSWYCNFDSDLLEPGLYIISRLPGFYKIADMLGVRPYGLHDGQCSSSCVGLQLWRRNTSNIE